MIQAILTDYQSHRDAIRSVRDSVFLVEQQIRPEDEIDDRDDVCMHALVLDKSIPIGTGRIDVGRDGKVGRVAVRKDYRRSGVGRLLMSTLEDFARTQSLERVWFHAQRSAVQFYLALGYETSGEEFLEADIPHILMQKKI